jgi:hypothetical protein
MAKWRNGEMGKRKIAKWRMRKGGNLRTGEMAKGETLNLGIAVLQRCRFAV